MVRGSVRIRKKATVKYVNHPEEEISAKSKRTKSIVKLEPADCDSEIEVNLHNPKEVAEFDCNEMVEVPKDAVKIEDAVVEELEGVGRSMEMVKCEPDIKEELEDFDEDEDYSNVEFSKYEYLLKNITIVNSDGNIALDENSRSEESSADDDPDDPDYLSEEEDEYEDDDDGLSCFHCDFTCQLKSQLADHLLSHKDKTMLKCTFCDDVFAKEKALQAHCSKKHASLVDDETLKYVCKLCKRRFATAKLRSNHTDAVHSKKAPFECSHCSKKFGRKSGLVQHLQSHVDIRRFKCKICEATFKAKAHKEAHMRRHFEVKEYKCDKCGKDFVRKDQLKRHILCVHKKTCLYKCSICNTSLKGHVLSHLRIHMQEKQHKCVECGKCFVQSSQLTVHMRTHTGARPYKCEVCKAAFAYSSACRTHMLTHTGEKPVKCQLCPAAFNQLPHLKKHMRCIHKSDKPYVCVPCREFFQTKSELKEHTATKKCKPISS